MVNEQIEKKIIFSEYYASENKEVRELLHSFRENKYIIKNSTGVGATHAMCNYTRGNLIILSPNNSMIEGKEGGNYESDFFISIYGGGSSSKWHAVLTYLMNTPKDRQNIVINCNPEQILIAKTNPQLYPLLKAFNVFIDEAHAYTADSGYRPNMGRTMEIIYNEFSGGITLSTATPNPFFFDVPPELNFKKYVIEREGGKTKQLAYSEDLKDARTFIINEIDKENKVCVFSNNKQIHTAKPSRDEALKYVNLTGDNLRIKLQPFGRGNDEVKAPDLFEDADVIFLSSAFFAGFDIPIDCSVLIISEQKSQATKININSVVQGYGRCRETVKNALYINVTAKFDNNKKPIHFPTSLNEVSKQIEIFNYDIKNVGEKIKKFGGMSVKNATPEGYVNRLEVGSYTLNSVSDYFQFNKKNRIELFKGYNFQLYDYVCAHTNKEKGKQPPFNEKINNLFQLPTKQLYYDYLKIKDEVKYKKDVGNFNYKSGLMYLSVHLIKKYNIVPLIEMVGKKRLEPARFYAALNNWMRVNSPLDYLTEQLTSQQLVQAKNMYKEDAIPLIDEQIVREWHMFYSMYRVGVGNYNDEIKRYLFIREMAGNEKIITTATRDKENRNSKAFRAVLKALKPKYGNITTKEEDTIKKIVKSSFKRLDKSKKGKYTNLETKDIAQKKVINLHIQLIHMGVGNYANKYTGYREYGAITEVPKQLRGLLPLKYIELDITSANPQFIDHVYGSNIGFQVYRNIMKAKGIERNKAKVLFNTYLNNHRFSVKKAYHFFNAVCGYTPEQAKHLSTLTAGGVSGRLFEVMTKVEDNLMSSLSNYLECDSIRLHDALIIPSWQCANIDLPTTFNNFKFHVSYFNFKGTYNHNTIEDKKQHFMFSDFETKPKAVNESTTIADLLKEYINI